MLSAMPEAVLERIRPHLEPVVLEQGQILIHVGDRVETVHFVEQGLISLVRTLADGRAIEVGAVGFRGMTFPGALCGAERAVVDAIVQVPGNGFRISRDVLSREVTGDPAFGTLVGDYFNYVLSQIAQTAACNGLHSIEQRCCRWLLIAHDNAGADRFDLTQEALAIMLGVQRTGVSLAARHLKRAGLIDYARGHVTVLDRQALEHAACECYREMRSEIDAVYGDRI